MHQNLRGHQVGYKSWYSQSFFKNSNTQCRYQCWGILIGWPGSQSCSDFGWKLGWKSVLRFSPMWEPAWRIGIDFKKKREPDEFSHENSNPVLRVLKQIWSLVLLILLAWVLLAHLVLLTRGYSSPLAITFFLLLLLLLSLLLLLLFSHCSNSIPLMK